MARRLGRYVDPRRLVTLRVPLSGTSVEPGDAIELTHVEGIGATGWADRLVRATRHELDLSAGVVRLDCYDLDLVIGRAGLWAEEATPDWEDASDEERRLYLFWAPDTDPTYSDGAPLKTWS